MPQSPAVGTDTQLQNLIDRGSNGDAAAHDGLLNHACDRLLRLTRNMFHGYPNLRRCRLGSTGSALGLGCLFQSPRPGFAGRGLE